ncbi:MAG TPA: hypothetical protein PLX85_00115 [Dehalococcoidia bacterium]|nr:hypothetical protein [Dehalococcoidia bacterium]
MALLLEWFAARVKKTLTWELRRASVGKDAYSLETFLCAEFPGGPYTVVRSAGFADDAWYELFAAEKSVGAWLTSSREGCALAEWHAAGAPAL